MTPVEWVKIARDIAAHHDDYDGFIVYEAPDAKVAATAIIAIELAGHIRTLKTSQLYTVAETMEMMGNAGKLAYPAPKG